jgi:hypothetical protein
MSVEIPDAPDVFRQALRKGAPVFTDNERSMTELLSNAPLALPVFTASLDEVESQTTQLRQNSTTWRFIARNPAGAIIFGDVSRSNGDPKLIRVSKDPRSLVALNAATEINERRETKDDIYELSLLRVAGVLVEALWLRSKTRKRDLFFPVLSASNELRINHAYSPTEFFAKLRDLSERFRSFDKTRDKIPPSKA